MGLISRVSSRTYRSTVDITSFKFTYGKIKPNTQNQSPVQMDIINSDILMAAAIAQLSQTGWSSLSKDLKNSVSEIILGHLPQEFILQATINICSILARGKQPNFEF